MVDGFRIEHISNCGLLIDFGDTRILVDALFQPENNFNNLSGELEEALYTENGKYSGADCLLYTHGHFDHYDYQQTRRYLDLNKDAIVAMPEGMYSTGGWTGEDENRLKLFIRGEDDQFEINGIEIFYYRTTHLDLDFRHFGYHYSYVISKDGINIFISGDARFNDTIEMILDRHGSFAAAFFNPIVLFFHKPVSMLNKKNIDQVFIYHLPLAEYDRFFYRDSAIKTYNKKKDILPKFTLLLGEMESLKI